MVTDLGEQSESSSGGEEEPSDIVDAKVDGEVNQEERDETSDEEVDEEDDENPSSSLPE